MISDQELMQAVEDATSEDFVVYGELGREKSSRVALLALERATGNLVVLIVTSSVSTTGETELGVDVQTALDARVPDGGTFCVACGTRLRPWGRFCQNCGTDVSGQDGTGDEDAASLRQAVEDAIAGDYELLGEMRRKEGGGRVFFAREKSSKRIAALRLNKAKGSDEFELDETMILKGPGKKDSGLTLQVTQMLRQLEPDAAVGIGQQPPRPKRTPTPAGSGPVGGKPAGSSSGAGSQQATAALNDAMASAKRMAANVMLAVKKNNAVVIGAAIAVVLALLVWAALSG